MNKPNKAESLGDHDLTKHFKTGNLTTSRDSWSYPPDIDLSFTHII